MERLYINYILLINMITENVVNVKIDGDQMSHLPRFKETDDGKSIVLLPCTADDGIGITEIIAVNKDPVPMNILPVRGGLRLQFNYDGQSFEIHLGRDYFQRVWLPKLVNVKNPKVTIGNKLYFN